jgi:hypothetical protein
LIILKITLPGVITLRDAGSTTRKPKINARKNIFLYTWKIFILPEMNNKRIKTEVIICAFRVLITLITIAI